MRPKLTAAIVLAAATITIAGCGSGSSSSTSAEQQVRAVEIHNVQALTSNHPQDACRYYQDANGCRSLLTTDTAKVVKSLIPSDWRDRVAHAKITISGNTATMAAWNGDSKDNRFAKVNGQWLVAAVR